MREHVRNFSIGVVAIAGLGGLAALLLLFGELSTVLESRYQVEVALNAAGGLRQGSLVTLHGVPVGLVETVGIASDDAAYPVRVRMVVDRDVSIPDPAAPAVETSLLGSGARLEIQPAGTTNSGRYFESGKVPLLYGDYRPIDQRLIAALDERLESIRGTLTSFDRFVKTYTELGTNLNDLVKPVDPDSPEAETNLRTTVARANKALTGADEAIRLAREWLGDDALRADVKGAVAKANELIARATDTVNVIGGLAANLDADRHVLVARLVQVFDQASGALGEVRSLMVQASSGNGTVGRLLKDPQLYENLADTARRLSAAMAAIQAVAEKLRAEGIIIQF